MRTCKISKCDGKHYAKGLCRVHWFREWNANNPLHAVWSGMKTRCYNPNATYYENYGGRGIKVCDRWLKFENFYQDMRDSYYAHKVLHGTTTLDRIDNDKNYMPSNCKWSTRKEQNNNMRMRKDNKSGYVGVYWHKVAQRWGVVYKAKSYGTFKTLEEAIAKRKELEKYT